MRKLFAAGYIPSRNSEKSKMTLQPYIVLYNPLPFVRPLAFKCLAEDMEHAEEQFMNAYPKADITWVVQTDDVEEALEDYWNA